VFKLALLLGKSVGEIETTMSSSELTEWLAYSQVEPLPDAHWDAALIAYTTSRSMGGKGHFEDFLPKTVKQKRKSEPKVKLDASQSRGLLSRLCGQSSPPKVQPASQPRSIGGAGRSGGD